jgi:hypothetical protein
MRTLLLLSLASFASMGSAQQPVDARIEDAARQVADAQAEAEASAIRPGDEDLSCEALQAEMVSISQAMQPLLEGPAQQFAADLSKLEEAQAEAEAQAPPRPRFGQIARGLATGVVPGMDRANAAAQQAQSIAQAEQARAETNENLEKVAALSEGTAAMAGPAMRGQRVLELAEGRNCAWLQEGGGPPGAFPPGSVPPGGPVPAR